LLVLPYRTSPLFLILLFHATATTAIYTLSLHDALPICRSSPDVGSQGRAHHTEMEGVRGPAGSRKWHTPQNRRRPGHLFLNDQAEPKNKRLNSSHHIISYADIGKNKTAKEAHRTSRIDL